MAAERHRPSSSCLRTQNAPLWPPTIMGGASPRQRGRRLSSAPEASLVRTWSRMAHRMQMGRSTPGTRAAARRPRAGRSMLHRAASEVSLDEQAAPILSRLARAVGGVIAAVQQRGGTRGSDDGAGEPAAARGRRRRAVHRQPPPLSTPKALEPAGMQQTPEMATCPRRARPTGRRRPAGQRRRATSRQACRRASCGGGVRRQ